MGGETDGELLDDGLHGSEVVRLMLVCQRGANRSAVGDGAGDQGPHVDAVGGPGAVGDDAQVEGENTPADGAGRRHIRQEQDRVAGVRSHSSPDSYKVYDRGSTHSRDI